jgi:tetratricopeptide (TPR) repeat protein
VKERRKLEGWTLAWQVHFFRLLGKAELARQIAEETQRIFNQIEATGDNTQRGQALLWRERGYLTSNLPEQIDYFRHSAELFQALGEPWWQGVVLAWAGEVATRMGDRVLGLDLHQQAVILSRTAGEPRMLARSLMNLAYDHLIHWEWETGAQLMEEAAGWFRSVGDLGSKATGELHLGVSYGWTGRLAEANDLLEVALVKMHQLGDRFYIAYGTLGLGTVQMCSRKYERAVLTIHEALQASRENGFRREEMNCQTQLGCLALVLGKPEQALTDFQHSNADLRQMGFAGELGIALGGQALAQHLLGQKDHAWDSLNEALKIAIETHSRFTLFTLPAALVVLLADAGKWEQAVEAYSAIMTDPMVASSHWFADLVGNRMELASEHLPEDVRLAAEKRGREGNVFDGLGRLAKEIGQF